LDPERRRHHDVATGRRGAQVFDIGIELPKTIEQRASAEFGRLSLDVHRALKAAPPTSPGML
jgi:hypothetical protein